MVIHFTDLHATVRSLLGSAEHSVELYAPYISAGALESICSSKQRAANISIVTTWKVADLVFGASDLRIYDYCKRNRIYLFLNQNLHLKTYVADYRRLLTGSANITNRALGLAQEANYETLVAIDAPDQKYLVHLAKIRREAHLVTDEIAKHFLDLYENQKDQVQKSFEQMNVLQKRLNEVLDKRSAFLISALPMSHSIDQLFSVLSGNTAFSDEILATASHDIANYGLDRDTFRSQEEFRHTLTTRFFAHPFIAALCRFIDEPKRFGAIKEWVQRTCTDVPVPSRRDLSENVRVLYNWLVDLGSDRFEVTRPRHSEIISPKRRNA